MTRLDFLRRNPGAEAALTFSQSLCFDVVPRVIRLKVDPEEERLDVRNCFSGYCPEFFVICGASKVSQETWIFSSVSSYRLNWILFTLHEKRLRKTKQFV